MTLGKNYHMYMIYRTVRNACINIVVEHIQTIFPFLGLNKPLSQMIHIGSLIQSVYVDSTYFL